MLKKILELVPLLNLINKYILKRKVEIEINDKIDSYKTECLEKGFDFHDTTALEDVLKKTSLDRGGNMVCNIIGSGKSALKAADAYNKNESYYTCNFGGLFDIPFDVYMFELASYNESKKQLSELQRDVILERRFYIKNLIIKNIWEGKIEKEYIEENYSSYTIVRDILFPKFTKLHKRGYLDILFEKMFDEKQFFILQVYTTVITLIQIAVFSGYKEIKVYGLDGKGSHFFHCTERFKNTELLKQIKSYIPKVDDEHHHKVGFNARKLIEPMAIYLQKNKGIQLTLIN